MPIESGSTIAITGARGFLGFHARAAARAFGAATVAIPLGDDFDVEQAVGAIEEASHVIHLAGVNRGTDVEVRELNIRFADQLGLCLDRAQQKPSRLAYGNSIHSQTDSNYGVSKHQASMILEATCSRNDVNFQNIILPNLFGEFGRPFYNSFIATFCDMIANGDKPEIAQDVELPLLHAQDAAELLLHSISDGNITVPATNRTVSSVRSMLGGFAELYSHGEMPNLRDSFERDLFNTYRSFTFPRECPIVHTSHSDDRGAFFEIVRSHGGDGQTAFSTTKPGISRGDHFHRRKVERFTVVSGEAVISLRKLFDSRVYTFEVSGNQPVSIDMPTFYAHRIVNTGNSPLCTTFWTNDLFDPLNPDTFAEVV